MKFSEVKFFRLISEPNNYLPPCKKRIVVNENEKPKCKIDELESHLEKVGKFSKATKLTFHSHKISELHFNQF